MEEEFEKWAEKKAREWVNILIKYQRDKHAFLNVYGLESFIIKALKAGHAYGKNDVEK